MRMSEDTKGPARLEGRAACEDTQGSERECHRTCPGDLQTVAVSVTAAFQTHWTGRIRKASGHLGAVNDFQSPCGACGAQGGGGG